MVETWKAAPGLNGVEISSEGNLRGTTNQPYIATDGYVRVRHHGDAYLVHRLACEAFHGPAPVGKKLVLHWNDIKDDNRAVNLRWGDAVENMADAKRNGIAVGPDAWRNKPRNHFRNEDRASEMISEI
ncbi:HNH endonuclease [Sphingobium sp. AP50]|uniref:HNH endonuclease signature motif containing protein n=1 Tax=Sphingobium sp. AP50 TaxID=1884369 RepID=UPI0008B6128A|nr:HNH endonuclease [Sphingobium sp. AP50]